MSILLLNLSRRRYLALITFIFMMVDFFGLPLLSNNPSTVLAARNSGCDQITGGLVACYPFHGNANDESGNGKHALNVYATLAPDRFGNEQKVYFFDGRDDYIELPFPGYLKNGTISVWVNIAPTNTKPHSKVFIISHALGENGDNVSLNNENNIMAFGIYSGRWHYASSGITPEKGKWYHFVGTWGTDGLKIYANGTLQGTNSNYTGGVPHGPTRCYLGTTSWPSLQPSYIMEGIIDDVRIYNRALTDEEIQHLADRTGIVTDDDRPENNKIDEPDGRHQRSRGTTQYRHRHGRGRHACGCQRDP